MGSLSAYGITLPAVPERIREAREFADAAAAAFGFDEDARYEIRLAASEAVTNAIQHGSHSPDDTIKFSVIEDDRVLHFNVADPGSFVPMLATDEPLPERGRGLSFLAHLMDEVCIRHGEPGTIVQFSKRLGHR
jgi:anti-sigma regulatory factor (Ser/Thr protein kinase)